MDFYFLKQKENQAGDCKIVCVNSPSNKKERENYHELKRIFRKT